MADPFANANNAAAGERFSADLRRGRPKVAVGTCDICGHARVEYAPPRVAGLVCAACLRLHGPVVTRG